MLSYFRTLFSGLISNVAERPDGKIPTTRVTNELAREINAMKPMILGGQTFPPRVAGEEPEDECGEGEQFEVHQRLTASTCGYEFVMSHP